MGLREKRYTPPDTIADAAPGLSGLTVVLFARKATTPARAMTVARSPKPIAMPMRPGITNVAAGVTNDTPNIAAANKAASGTGGTLSSSDCMFEPPTSPFDFRLPTSDLPPGESFFLRRYADPLRRAAERAGERCARQLRRVVLPGQVRCDHVLQVAAVHRLHDFRRCRVGKVTQPA